MNKIKRMQATRLRRQRRVRSSVRGSCDRPRLHVYRSSKHISAQLIDDEIGRTLAAASSYEKELREVSGTKSEIAFKVGALVGERALKAGATKVVFDRGPYKFHGRVKALAEAARKSGLEF